MIKKLSSYRPIEGTLTGVVTDLQENQVYWMVKDTIFIIPVERFTEYFTEVTGDADDAGADREGTAGHSI